MKSKLHALLGRITLFFETFPMRKYFLDPRKGGYLIEMKEEGETSYLIRNLEGGAILIEINRIHDHLVQLMKNAGVPIIPFEAMDDVYRGREKIEVLYEKYSRKNNN